ncbi:hypothetical protein TNCV_1390291 [Trichonephila clavipes]|nr:hypothetical protein TNCV_1390291 [Trichonephila clavipes]
MLHLGNEGLGVVDHPDLVYVTPLDSDEDLVAQVSEAASDKREIPDILEYHLNHLYQPYDVRLARECPPWPFKKPLTEKNLHSYQPLRHLQLAHARYGGAWLDQVEIMLIGDV